MDNGEKVLQVAAREIGYCRDKSGRSKYGEWYADRVNDEYFAYAPYCMMFDQYCYAQAGIPLPFKTASCGELLQWYRTNQPECVNAKPVRGCIVIFDFPGTAYSTDHTGLFVSMDALHITTIDGNTSNGNESNGGWVQQRKRSRVYANPTFIVPRELSTDTEDDMKRYGSLDEIMEYAKWAYPTVKKLVDAKAIQGTGRTLDLSEDMLRVLVINDRMGVYGK